MLQPAVTPDTLQSVEQFSSNNNQRAQRASTEMMQARSLAAGDKDRMAMAAENDKNRQFQERERMASEALNERLRQSEMRKEALLADSHAKSLARIYGGVQGIDDEMADIDAEELKLENEKLVDLSVLDSLRNPETGEINLQGGQLEKYLLESVTAEDDLYNNLTQTFMNGLNDASAVTLSDSADDLTLAALGPRASQAPSSQTKRKMFDTGSTPSTGGKIANQMVDWLDKVVNMGIAGVEDAMSQAVGEGPIIPPEEQARRAKFIANNAMQAVVAKSVDVFAPSLVDADTPDSELLKGAIKGFLFSAVSLQGEMAAGEAPNSPSRMDLEAKLNQSAEALTALNVGPHELKAMVDSIGQFATAARQSRQANVNERLLAGEKVTPAEQEFNNRIFEGLGQLGATLKTVGPYKGFDPTARRKSIERALILYRQATNEKSLNDQISTIGLTPAQQAEVLSRYKQGGVERGHTLEAGATAKSRRINEGKAKKTKLQTKRDRALERVDVQSAQDQAAILQQMLSEGF